MKYVLAVAAVVLMLIVVADARRSGPGTDRDASIDSPPPISPAPTEPAAELPAPEPPSMPAAPAPPPDATFATHSVAFKGDQLDECVDFVVTPEPGHEAEAAAVFAKPIKGSQKIERPCAEQFAGRTVLATCSFAGQKPGWAVRMISSCYSVASVIDSDFQMRNCLEMHGQWAAVPRDDPAVLHERIQQHAHRAERALRSAAKALGDTGDGE